MNVVFFEAAAELRRWLERHHASAAELWIGFYKKTSGRGGVTYLEAVDQALCFGWIDGVRKTVDAVSYTNRFSPRKPKSHWSAVNTRRIGELRKLGLVRPVGLTAFERRDRRQKGLYSYENRPQRLEERYEKKFKQNSKAWEFFRAQSPSYQRTAAWWVVSAAKEETRGKRLDTLIELSARGRRLGP